jgi:hypothetical protein
MQQQFLPTGRVSYLPISEYLGEGHFTTLSASDHTVNMARRVVDATYMRVTVHVAGPKDAATMMVAAAGVDSSPVTRPPPITGGLRQLLRQIIECGLAVLRRARILVLLCFLGNQVWQDVGLKLGVRIINCGIDYFDVPLCLIVEARTADVRKFSPVMGRVSGIELLQCHL